MQNSAHKRITVGFRGSVTVKDFMVDAKAYLCELTDPFDPDSGETLGIHHGFYGECNGRDGARRFCEVHMH